MLDTDQHLIFTVQKKIQQSLHKLIQPSDAKVLVAVSAGQDSLCLLHVMLNLPKEWNVKVIVGHTDHQWETDIGIASHLRSVCEDWGVPCFIKTPDTVLKQSEDAARRWRRTTLTAIAEEQGCTHIVLGHTLTDNTETVLFNLVRGTGMKGLCGIPISSKVTEDITLVRPMLQISRKQTGDYCDSLNLPVLVDVLNSSDLYTRCRVRNNVMPLLKSQVHNSCEQNIANMSAILTDEEDYMHGMAQTILDQCTHTGDEIGVLGEHHPETLVLRYCLANSHIAMQRRVVRLFLQENMKEAVKHSYVDGIINLYNNRIKGYFKALPKGNYIEYDKYALTFHKSS